MRFIRRESAGTSCASVPSHLQLASTVVRFASRTCAYVTPKFEVNLVLAFCSPRRASEDRPFSTPVNFFNVDFCFSTLVPRRDDTQGRRENIQVNYFGPVLKRS